LAPEVVDTLGSHSWPGNVRELENCLTRAVVLATGNVIRPEYLALGPPVAEPRRRLARLEEVEREHVAYVLNAMRGNKSRTAETLGISRPRLVRMIKKYGLEGGESELDQEPEPPD
jgi:DNA-binding NtrC family response regulator